ncbi:MAG: amidohydrolase [Herminiimonas sp.]|nr:amidohydrolase [Herminiimonas sp.]
MDFQLLFRNAMVFDGSGAPPAQRDVAVADGKIVALRDSNDLLDTWHAAEVIDAHGLALMPGIIDSHTHFDAQITWDPTLAPSPALGVTTTVIGNCGFAIAPCRPEHRELTMRNLTQVEGMSLDVLKRGIDWNFESFGEYLEQVRKHRSVPNVAAYVGHSSVRTYVMGEAAAERAASEEEIARMAELVRDAMRQGAVGFASSTSPAHNGEGGKPMPSRLAADEEHLALIKAMAEPVNGKSGGVYMVTKGGQMPVSLLEEMSAVSGRPVMIAALLHNSTNPQAVFKDLDAITAANQRGRRVVGQVSCCPLSMDFTLASAYPFEGLKSWQPALGLRGPALKAVLADPGFRDALRRELSAPAVFRLFNGEWNKVHITEAASVANRQYEQMPLDALARRLGGDPLDVMLDVALEEDLQTVFTAMLLNSDEPEVQKMLNHPYSLITLSDAGAHLTFFNDAGFGLHLLGHWSRDLRAMSMSEAVRQLTSLPAGIFGFEGRGLIREGYAADLLLFDPKTVARGPSHRVFDLPGGAPRLHTDAVGVHGVWVAGQMVANENGMLSGAPLAGELITRFAA